MAEAVLQAEIKILRLAEPFRIAHGTSLERRVLRLRWGDAVGEAPFVPYYGEIPEETLRWLQSLAWNGSPPPSRGPRAGRLALDLLWHDAIGKSRHKPVWSLLGLNGDKIPVACRSLGIPDDLDNFADKVRDLSAQFRVLKLKLGSGNLDFDEAIAARARETAPHAALFADANGGWTVAEAATIIPRLTRYRLEFVEQPISHGLELDGWRELRAALPSAPLPLYADESAQNADDVRRLGDLVNGVNVKLLKCGTFSESVAMCRTARVMGKGVLLGCMIESSIGVTAAAHLASLADLVDLDGHLYVANDDHEGISFDATGRLQLPSRPGLGVVPRAESR